MLDMLSRREKSSGSASRVCGEAGLRVGDDLLGSGAALEVDGEEGGRALSILSLGRVELRRRKDISK